MIEIKALPARKWKEYRDLRLEALKKDPTSFGMAYEDEICYDEKCWKGKIKNVFFAIDNDKLIGMIGYRFEDIFKMRHVAFIVDLYVKKEYRGTGLVRN